MGDDIYPMQPVTMQPVTILAPQCAREQLGTPVVAALMLTSGNSGLPGELLKFPYRPYSQTRVLCMPVGAVAV